MKIEAIVFDLGNVLVDIHPEVVTKELAKYTEQSPRLLSGFFLSPAHLDLMAGRIDLSALHQHFCDQFRSTLPYSLFRIIWGKTIGQAKEGIAELVDDLLAAGFRLYVCSNTDPLHWQISREKCPFLKKFSGYILSYDIGLNKPHPGVFDAVTALAGVPADLCLFIDDTPTNVESANQAGLLTVQADNSRQIRSALKARGVPL